MTTTISVNDRNCSTCAHWRPDVGVVGRCVDPADPQRRPGSVVRTRCSYVCGSWTPKNVPIRNAD